MGFFKKIANLFSGSKSSDDRLLTLYALCNKGREPVVGTVDLFNELSLTEDDGYYVRKVVHTSGENRNFGQVEFELWFDRNKNLDRHEVTGGRWLEPEEYEQEMARFYNKDEVAEETTDE